MRDAEFNEVDLIGANIEDQLDMSGSKFNGLMDMDSLQIDGHLFMNDSAEFVKDVSLVFSDLNGSLDLSRSTFASFDLTGTQIRGELVLNDTKWFEGAQLVLTNTTVGILKDTEEAWPGKLDLNSFTYASWRRVPKNGNPVDRDPFNVSWFKSWLARQEQYAPQPYEQLANVLLKEGYETKSRDILVASRERQRDEAPWLNKVWLTLLQFSIGYGYRIYYAFLWAGLLIILGALVLMISKSSPYKGKLADSMLYSVDRLLPAIELHHGNDVKEPTGWVRYYFVIHQLLGFLLAFFIVAAITGLAR
jgi:hypothetical protein